jgi:hypothetical protein
MLLRCSASASKGGVLETTTHRHRCADLLFQILELPYFDLHRDW